MSYVKIYSADDLIKTKNMMNILKNKGISIYAKDQSTEEFFEIAEDMAFFVKNIYVQEQRTKEAVDLIKETEEKEQETEDKVYTIPWYSKYRYLITCINTILLFVFFAIIIVYSFIKTF